MSKDRAQFKRYERARIDVDYEYAVCAWAKHLNVSEKQVKDAVAAVGNHADKVMEHLNAGAPSRRAAGQDRPSDH